MSLQKDQIIAQQCYICGTFFQDKVRLGVHIARCYEDACDRGENYHPHPDILLDEVRYSQYMLGGEREKKFRDAEKRKVAFSTQDEFANLHSQLGGSPLKQQQPASSPKQQQPKFPASTYQNDFNKDKKTKTPLNTNPIDHVPAKNNNDDYPQQRISTPRGGNSNNDGAVRFNLPTPTAPSPKSYSSSSSPTSMNNNKSGGGGGGYSLASRSSAPQQSSSPPTFAQPGVNTLRNELASELDKVREFMQAEKMKSAERDAVMATISSHGGSGSPSSGRSYNPKANAAPPILKPQSYESPNSGRRNNNNYSYENPADGNNNFAPIPKSYLPHIDTGSNNTNIISSPTTPRGRNSNHAGGAGGGVRGTFTGANKNHIPVTDEDTGKPMMVTDIGQAIHGGGFEASPEERVPCGRCGRMFAPGKVDAHEDVCVSKPRGIHRR